jgi:tRNA-2-methylthio-N6-dimethylallyladenosine synthase
LRASVYIETLGCQMNVSDTERAKTRLLDAGYVISDSIHASDVVIFNTCSVRERAAQKVFTRIGEVRKSLVNKQPLIGVMGCVAQLEGEALFDASGSVNLVIGTRAIDRIPTTIERALKGQTEVLDLGEHQEGEIGNTNPLIRHSPYVAFVPIIEGCNKFCTYCIVPYSRGREKSRLASEVLTEVMQLRDLGFKEVHLIGQNVNSYRPKSNVGLEGISGATPFSKLLRAVASTGMERIKFTTSFPRDFHRDIVAAIEEHENLCNWVHLPVQSGSNRILRSMRRGYSIEDYLRHVDAIKGSKRKIALTSDIILGFPGETQEEFEDTIRLIERCQYDSLYIFKYSVRPGTPAANLVDNVSVEEKGARFLALETIQKGIQKTIFNGYVGRQVRVLVEGISRKSNLDMTGHSTCHKVVNFSGDGVLAGREVLIQITAAKANSLYGTVASGPCK